MTQKRLTAVARVVFEYRPRTIKDEPAREVGSVLDGQIEQLGHTIVKEDNGWGNCLGCGQRWHNRHRRQILTLGPCPNEALWGDMNYDSSIPKRVSRGCGIVWAGQTLHRSHALSWTRGLVICMRCGSYSQGTRVRYLSEVCGGNPKSKHGRASLKAYREGRHPMGSLGTWPFDSDVPCPIVFKVQP